MLLGAAAAVIGVLYMLFVCSSITNESVNKALSKQSENSR